MNMNGNICGEVPFCALKNHLRYARTRSIKSSAISWDGNFSLSGFSKCRRMWSSKTSAIRLLTPPRTSASSIRMSAQSSPPESERSIAFTWPHISHINIKLRLRAAGALFIGVPISVRQRMFGWTPAQCRLQIAVARPPSRLMIATVVRHGRLRLCLRYFRQTPLHRGRRRSP